VEIKEKIEIQTYFINIHVNKTNKFQVHMHLGLGPNKSACKIISNVWRGDYYLVMISTMVMTRSLLACCGCQFHWQEISLSLLYVKEIVLSKDAHGHST